MTDTTFWNNSTINGVNYNIESMLTVLFAKFHEYDIFHVPARNLDREIAPGESFGSNIMITIDDADQIIHFTLSKAGKMQCVFNFGNSGFNYTSKFTGTDIMTDVSYSAGSNAFVAAGAHVWIWTP